MGVSGLLSALSSIQKPCSLKDFSGKTLAVDAYGWLHRGAIACATELATGKPTTKFVDFAMHRVRMLVHFGVTPYLVFDGDRLPSKAGVEQSRAERRQETRKRGLELLRLGRISQAYQELQKALDINPTMARMLIEELKRNNIPYVVAPYEADSQMAYLERHGHVDGVLSEDSDLLVFGVKTLLTKLDQYGNCVMIRQADFCACSGINLTGWRIDDFRCMAILTGCDYLEGIKNVGLKKANRLVRKYKNIDHILRGAQLEHKLRVPSDYLGKFLLAEKTFLYQWVFCPEAQKLVHLTAPEKESDLDGLDCIGAFVDADVAKQVASGDLDPITKKKIVYDSNAGKNQRSNQTRTPLLQKSDKDGSGKSKSIDTFFKKRVPLAELDPNSFTPSPHQQEVLREQSHLFAGRTPSTISLTPRTENDTPSRQPSRILTPRSTNSGHAWKRQRLCSDATDNEDVIGLEGGATSSRFFSAKGRDDSTNAKKKQKHRHAFEVWSENSPCQSKLDSHSESPDHPVDASSITTNVNKPNALSDQKCPDRSNDRIDFIESTTRQDKATQFEVYSTLNSTTKGSPFGKGLLAQVSTLSRTAKTQGLKFATAPLSPRSQPSHTLRTAVPCTPRKPQKPAVAPAQEAEVVVEESPSQNDAHAVQKFSVKQFGLPTPQASSLSEAAFCRGSEENLVLDSDIESGGYSSPHERQIDSISNSSPLRPVSAHEPDADTFDGDISDGDHGQGSLEGHESTIGESVLDLKKFLYRGVAPLT